MKEENGRCRKNEEEEEGDDDGKEMGEQEGSSLCLKSYISAHSGRVMLGN